MRIRVESDIAESTRVVQMRGLFDIPQRQKIVHEWNPNFDLESGAWNIGLIVGPSGSGKSTIARHYFPGSSAPTAEWPQGAAIIDGFPESAKIKEISEALSSVGFSSPPDWLKPYAVLSTGQKFRADLARALIAQEGIIVFDEFTSVVDRTVAKIASAALAKVIRRKKMQFVAVSCHYDIEDWLQPDWVYDTAKETFTRRLLQPRPAVTLTIEKCQRSLWPLFAQHHYLSHDIMPNATCFVAKWLTNFVCFSCWVPFFGAGNKKREHRTVVLPDYQGIGIGNAVSDFMASIWKALGYTPTSTTTHPAMIAARQRNPNWVLTRAPSLGGTTDKIKHASTRLTAGFKYIGPAASTIRAKALLNG